MFDDKKFKLKCPFSLIGNARSLILAALEVD